MHLIPWLRASAPRARKRQPARARLELEPLEARAVPSAAPHDILYVGDGSDDSVKSFDATTGAFVGTAVAPARGGLHGPRGMVFEDPAHLLVVNQNVNQPFNGEVLDYNIRTGTPRGAVVPSSSPDAPFAPRGMVLSGHTLYVADVEGATTAGGRIALYDVHSGQLLGSLTPANFPGQFNPRGVVFGPDGDLYVSVFDTTNPLAGYVVRFDPNSGASAVVAANNGDGIDQPGEIKDLHRPEGLAFGPDGQLYVTSFRADAGDTDKILVLNGSTGALQDEIPLDQVGQPRAFAQALEFGPDGRLFVPVTGNGPDTGSVRRYDVATHGYTVFVAAGGPLGQGWYLTFGQTDAATLAYNPRQGAELMEGQDGDGAATSTPSTDALSALLAWKKWHDLYSESDW
jgi:hypothetical protein